MPEPQHHLVVTFYFRPDLCAGSFRNTAFVEALKRKVSPSDKITVFTTSPNRYSTHRVDADSIEVDGNVTIHRFDIPKHTSGFRDQIRSFYAFYSQSLKASRNLEVSAVYASSSRLFTAYLGSVISRRKKVQLFLDMRDLFRENILEILKNPVIKLPLRVFLGMIENRAFGRARHINLVSKGFEADFMGWKKPLSFHPNGIDEEFLNVMPVGSGSIDSKKIITYAGNMGEGQGLDRIIPDVAPLLADRYIFHLYGDGGTRKRLEARIKELNISNVILHNPIKRKELVEVYKRSDFLLVHLNQLKAFEKALPSKFFEYGAIGLPIIAGVSGYAKTFVQKELPDSIVFKPCDGTEFVNRLSAYKPHPVDREAFINKFKRETIMSQLADLYLKSVNQHER